MAFADEGDPGKLPDERSLDRPMSSSPMESKPPPDKPKEEVDASLVQRIATGDREAFAQLYDRFSRPLLATALRILNDPTEAEDIVHDVFVSLWTKASDYEASRGTAFSWAITLTRNRAIDRLRSRKRRFELLDQSAPSDLGYNDTHTHDTTSAGDLFLKEKAAAVRSAVAELAADQRNALELAFFRGLTQQEIAAQLKQPLGTVKARIRRGLIKLRDSLAQRL